MCGRYAATLPPEMLAELFNILKSVDVPPPRFNIKPTDPILAIRQKNGERDAKILRWGLIPSWVKDLKDFPLLINARADYDRATERLTIWYSSQAPHLFRTVLADAIDFPESRIHVITREVGGGFGMKLHYFPEEVLAALATLSLRRAVKWIEDRLESFVGSTHAREQVIELTVGARRDRTSERSEASSVIASASTITGTSVESTAVSRRRASSSVPKPGPTTQDCTLRSRGSSSCTTTSVLASGWAFSHTPVHTSQVAEVNTTTSQGTSGASKSARSTWVGTE